VTAVAAAGAGFLLAVLWFDLMFDLLLRRPRIRIAPHQAALRIAAGDVRAWVAWASLALAVPAFVVAALLALQVAESL
jgi:hypothetical protein